jgi:HTH-type transcriptional regulator, glycine betaine synthesis regulator
MSDSRTLSPAEQDLIEEFGNIYESYGLKRLQGLIVGLLLTQDDPVSLDDMVELLGHSKGPISVAVRRIDDIGLARKVNGPVNRRNYYTAHPDLFLNNFKFNMATVRKNRELAERFLSRIHAEGATGREETVRNLEHMHAFYDLMESFYQDFAGRWAEIKQARLEQEHASSSTGERSTSEESGTGGSVSERSVSRGS